jgi:hypothetical protein
MAATTRSSTLYTKLHVNKYLGDARDRGGPVFLIPFQHTVVSGETGGASAGVQDIVNLCVLPANCMVVGLRFVSDAVWASAGANGTLELGDADDTDRYLVATELYTAAGSPITGDGKTVNLLAFAGQNYKPTADTIVIATYKVANPTVGKIFKGVFEVILGA